MLVPLRVKSAYSLESGTASIDRLVDRAAALGLPALALTDADNLYGQILFHRLARAKGIRPLTGVELDDFVLIARDRRGYESLCRIITRRKLVPGAGDPVRSIHQDGGGLFILTSRVAALERLLVAPEVDRSAVRLLLTRPHDSIADEEKLLATARRLTIPLVADADIIFLDPADHPLHVLKVAISQNLLVTQVKERHLAAPLARHFPGPRELEQLFADIPEAITETHRIAAACDLDLRKTKPIFPRIPLPPGETAYSHLVKVAFRGLERRRPRIASPYLERLTRELRIIEKLGFCEYFIVVGDIVRFARDKKIEVVGRGSGAGSLVAYALGITNVDPLEHGLYFERFLHEGRSDLPDIDIDLCWIRRDEVIENVYRTYGDDKVAMISSHVTFQPHMAFRETLKAFGVPAEEVNRYSRRLPYIYPDVTSRTPLRDIIVSSPHREVPLEDEPFKTAIPLAERLINLPHHLSVHPGGIVIGDRALDAYVPLEKAHKGIVVTQYDMYSIEDVGLVKIDLLGNRCLTELQETLELVATHRQAESPPATLAEIPDGDPATLELLQSARTIGCFQLESPAMRSLLAKLKVQGVRDCIAAVAIIRPGAAAGGAKAAFIRRRRGEEPTEYLHPVLRKLLDASHGVVIYEEDVMCIASAVTGMTLAEGDALRSAIKKCKSSAEMLQLENELLRQAVRNDIAPDVARAIWRDLKKFASYCFSKAHASGYGLLAYQSAYLKAHFPLELGCALLNNHAGLYSTRTIAAEILRSGSRILHPAINSSGVRFALEDGAIRTALGRVKGLAASSIESILASRQAHGPFQSLSDFLRRVRMPRRETEALILGGAFDDLPARRQDMAPLNHPQLLWELASTPNNHDGDCPLSPSLLPDTSTPIHPPLPPYDPMTQVRNELEVLGMALTDAPLRLLRAEASRRGCLTTLAATLEPGRRVKIAGLLAASRTVRTRKGQMMRFLTIEDETGLLEATLFPGIHRETAGRIRGIGPYILEGTVEEDHDSPSLNVAAVKLWDR